MHQPIKGVKRSIASEHVGLLSRKSIRPETASPHVSESEYSSILIPTGRRIRIVRLGGHEGLDLG